MQNEVKLCFSQIWNVTAQNPVGPVIARERATEAISLLLKREEIASAEKLHRNDRVILFGNHQYFEQLLRNYSFMNSKRIFSKKRGYFHFTLL